MVTCDGCRFCCWTFGVPDLDKPPLSHCKHECKKGCSLFSKPERPEMCGWFRCPYLDGHSIHRPDTFQPLLEELGGNIGNYIPCISKDIPVEEASNRIRKTRTLPAVIYIGNEPYQVIMPLDRNKDSTWTDRKVGITYA